MADTVSAERTWYCINCGARLEPVHRFCWSCGAPRWSPEPESPPPAAEAERPPPVPGTQVFGAAAAPRVETRVSLGLLPWLYAVGAIFFLVQATQGAAYLLSPGGRAQLAASFAHQGISGSVQQGFLAVYWVILVGGSLVAAVLHGAAFYGLRRYRRWGWLAAVAVAALWSLLIVGIPVLLRLVNRSVRQAFGVD